MITPPSPFTQFLAELVASPLRRTLWFPCGTCSGFGYVAYGGDHHFCPYCKGERGKWETVPVVERGDSIYYAGNEPPEVRAA